MGTSCADEAAAAKMTSTRVVYWFCMVDS
jgi:hypothetical protein